MLHLVDPENDAALVQGTLADYGADEIPEDTGIDWRDRLLFDGKKVSGCVANAVTILGNDARWKDVLAFDTFRQCVIAQQSPPWDSDDRPAVCEPGDWTDADTVRASAWLHRNYSIKVGREQVFDAIRVVADRNVVHPLRDEIDGYTWDKVPRIDTWLSTYLGAAPTPYAAKVGRWILVSAMARLYKPGCKVDTAAVLEGPQGLKKSTALRTLFGAAYFNDTPLDLESKDRFVALRGQWGIELAELDSLSRAEVARVKSYMSSPIDTYRPPYGRGLVAVPRSCIFIGTVNEDTYLRDETGNRRFWPVKCSVVDIDALTRDRAQLWAEARILYRAGCRWWPEGSEHTECGDEQGQRLVTDPWHAAIGTYLATRGPEAFVTIEDILSTLLGIERGRHGQTEANRVARVLRAHGWIRRQRRTTGGREWGYVAPIVTSVTGAASEVVP